MAAEVSVQQMALTRNLEFMERVQAMLARTSGEILSEPGNTPYHAYRAQYAQSVIRAPQMMAQQAGPVVVMGVNVIAATTYDEQTKTSSCTILDLDLQSQIMTLWNALAGIDTPS